MVKYYAVRTGHTPGVYTSWNDCLDQIRGFKGAKFKSFQTSEEAELFVSGKDPSLDPNSTSYVAKFYGVHSGKVPGVYTDWASAEQQVIGVLKPKVRCFSTKEEAEAFVKHGPMVADPSDERKRIQKQPPAVNHNESGTDEIADNTFAEDSNELPCPKKLRVDGSSLPNKELNETVSASRNKQDGISPKTKKQTQLKKSPVLRIYTDGSALGNGKSASMAGVGVWFGDQDTRNISEPLLGPRQTNQRAELTAILRAINVAPIHREVLIFTDSQYAINCVTVWHLNWGRNNWTTSLGKPVENRDLIQEILETIETRKDYGSRTRFEWVKGHTGRNDGNSQADRLAVQGAKMNRPANP
ncbi:ribonuclease H-like domain-containing protein [Geopyxis carbonaria]|nr:ribonuclease H-like domain-containing protein [Geopyxis carbonaria]